MWRFIITAVLAISAWGCASGASNPGPPPVPPRARLVTLDEAQPAHRLGKERVSAKVDILGIKAGELTTVVSNPCSRSGQQTITMRSDMGTAGVVRWFKEVNGDSATLMDADTALPFASDTHIRDGDVLRRYRVWYRSGRFRYIYDKTERPRRRGLHSVPQKEHAHDMQSAVVLLRSWKPEAAGTEGYFYVVIGRRLWRADVVYRGREVLEVQSVPTPVVRVDGIAHRLRHKPGKEHEPRKFSLWFTDDEQRIPVRVHGDAKYGTVKFYFRDHEVLAKTDACAEQLQLDAPRPNKRKDGKGKKRGESNADRRERAETGNPREAAKNGAQHKAHPPPAGQNAREQEKEERAASERPEAPKPKEPPSATQPDSDPSEGPQPDADPPEASQPDADPPEASQPEADTP